MNKILKKKADLSRQTGQFKYEFYNISEKKISRAYFVISTIEGSWRMTVRINHGAFPLMYSAAMDGDNYTLQGYALLMFSLSQALVNEDRVVKDVTKALFRWNERIMDEAKEEAAKVTESQEMGAQAFMAGVIEYTEANEKERKFIRKRDKEIIEEIISENEQK